MEKNILFYTSLVIEFILLAIYAIVGFACDAISKVIGVLVSIPIIIGVVAYSLLTNERTCPTWIKSLYTFAGDWRLKRSNYKVTSFLLRSILD